VLVIDHDERIRALLGEFLSDEGYEVSLAPDEWHAVGVVLQTLPDVALLDLATPGSTGWRFLALQAEHPLLAGIPVLVPSEFVANLEAEKASRSPFLLASFLEAVRRLAGPAVPGPVPRRTPEGTAQPHSRAASHA
jgi:CheY-like chemotaxis protein